MKKKSKVTIAAWLFCGLIGGLFLGLIGFVIGAFIGWVVFK